MQDQKGQCIVAKEAQKIYPGQKIDQGKKGLK